MQELLSAIRLGEPTQSRALIVKRQRPERGYNRTTPFWEMSMVEITVTNKVYGLACQT